MLSCSPLLPWHLFSQNHFLLTFFFASAKKDLAIRTLSEKLRLFSGQQNEVRTFLSFFFVLMIFPFVALFVQGNVTKLERLGMLLSLSFGLCFSSHATISFCCFVFRFIFSDVLRASFLLDRDARVWSWDTSWSCCSARVAVACAANREWRRQKQSSLLLRSDSSFHCLTAYCEKLLLSLAVESIWSLTRHW